MAGVARPAGFRRAARGAFFGAASALVYLACELGLSLWLSGLALHDRQVPGVGAGFAALLLGTYAALGALVGAGLGWALAEASARRIAAGTALALVVAHAAVLIRTSAPGADLFLALFACVLAGTPLLAFGLGRSGPWEFAANPWTASLAVVGVAALAFDWSASGPARWAGCVAWLAAVFGGSWIARTGPARARPSRPGSLGSGFGAAGLAALGVSTVWVLTGRPAPPLPIPAPAPPAASRPHVVLITLDTLRSDHLSAYGYARRTSPELDTLAGESTLYRTAIASSDLTLSTHASLFTGLYARHHGARLHGRKGPRGLADRFETLAETLEGAGYLSLAVVANHSYLASHYGLDQGFRFYDDRRPVPPRPRLPLRLVSHWLARGLELAARPFGGLGGDHVPYRRAEEINREVFSLLDRFSGAGAPLFLFVNYVDPHWPYAPPAPFDVRFPGRGAFEPLAPGGYRDLRNQARPLDPGRRAHLISQYDGEIAYLDAQLGRLFQRLRRLGLWDSSLVVVTSDHGEAFGEHGLVFHGVSVHEHQVRVPLLIKRPGQRSGRVEEERVGTVDLMPTILDAVGLPVPRNLAGVSLLRPGPWRREIISESHPDPLLYEADPRFRRTQRALYQGDLKLVVSSPGGSRLFDLSRDPGEQNGMESEPRLAAGMRLRLDRWLGVAGDAPGEPVQLAEEVRDRLKALGYAE